MYVVNTRLIINEFVDLQHKNYKFKFSLNIIEICLIIRLIKLSKRCAIP